MNAIARKLSFLAVLLTLLPNVAGAAVDDESRYAALIGVDWKSLDAILADDFFYLFAGEEVNVVTTGLLNVRTRPEI